MAIRRIITFDHFPFLNGFGISPTNANDKYMASLLPDAIANVTAPGYGYCGITTSYPTGAITRSGNWLSISKISPGSGYYKSSFGLPYLAQSARDVARSYVGFRYIGTVAGAGVQVFHMKSPSTGTALFSFDMASLGLAASTEYYIEIMIDRVRKLAVAWVNDARVASVSCDFVAYATTYPDVAMWIGPVENPGTSTGNTHYQRDIYFVDDMGDGLQESGRLGPGLAAQLTMSSGDLTNWGTSSGSGAYADMNQPITLTAYTPNATPAAVSTYLQDPATLSFGSPFGAGDTIRGMQLAVSAQGLSGAALLKPSWSKAGQSVSTGNIAFNQGAALFNQSSTVLTRGPDGKRLRGADLPNMQLSLVPSL